jgi:hypothetical protein
MELSPETLATIFRGHLDFCCLTLEALTVYSGADPDNLRIWIKKNLLPHNEPSQGMIKKFSLRSVLMAKLMDELVKQGKSPKQACEEAKTQIISLCVNSTADLFQDSDPEVQALKAEEQRIYKLLSTRVKQGAHREFLYKGNKILTDRALQNLLNKRLITKIGICYKLQSS